MKEYKKVLVFLLISILIGATVKLAQIYSDFNKHNEKIQSASQKYQERKWKTALEIYESVPIGNLDEKNLYQFATAAYLTENYQKSYELYLKYPQAGAEFSHFRNYNLACLGSLIADKEGYYWNLYEGYNFIKYAYEQGFDDLNHIKNDADLQTLLKVLFKSKDLSKELSNKKYLDLQGQLPYPETIQVDQILDWELHRYIVPLRANDSPDICIVIGLIDFDPFPNAHKARILYYRMNASKYLLIYTEEIQLSEFNSLKVAQSANSNFEIQTPLVFDFDGDGNSEFVLPMDTYAGPCGTSTTAYIFSNKNSNAVNFRKIRGRLNFLQEAENHYLWHIEKDCGGVIPSNFSIECYAFEKSQLKSIPVMESAMNQIVENMTEPKATLETTKGGASNNRPYFLLVDYYLTNFPHYRNQKWFDEYFVPNILFKKIKPLCTSERFEEVMINCKERFLEKLNDI